MDRFTFFKALASGRKYQNGITNGDFASGLTSWEFSNAGSPAVNAGVLQFTPTAAPSSANLTHHAYKTITVVSGHVLYGCAHVRGKTTVNLQFTNIVFASVGQNDTWQWISGIYAGVSTFSRAFGLRDTAASGWTQTECDRIGYVDLTNLFGAGNEPTQAWCDANIRPNMIW